MIDSSTNISKLLFGLILSSGFILALPAQQELPRVFNEASVPDIAEDSAALMSFRLSRNALDLGMPSVAISYLEIIDRDNLSDDQKMDADWLLVKAYLQQDRINEITDLIPQDWKEKGDDRWGFVELFLSYSSDSEISSGLEELGSRENWKEHPDLIPWLDYFLGVRAFRVGDVNTSNLYFENAIDAAINESQKAQFETLIWREEILTGDASEETAISLKSQIENALNPSVVSSLVQQYAAVLVRLGRESEALRVIEDQLAVMNETQRSQEDRLLMFTSLISERRSGRSDLALVDILRNGEQERIRELAFYEWSKSVRDSDAAAEVGASIFARNADPLANRFRLFSAFVNLNEGNLLAADASLVRLLNSNPSEETLESALVLKVASLWAESPPQYRLATEYLSRLLNLQTDDASKNRINEFIGDSFYLNGDYENALPYYERLVESYSGNVETLGNLYKWVDCLIIQGRLEGAIEAMDRFYERSESFTQLVWGCEWNLNLALFQTNQLDRAINRFEALDTRLASQTDSWAVISRLRIAWMLGYLHLQQGDAALCLEASTGLAESLTQDLLEDDSVTSIRDELIILQARALLALDRSSEALDLFTQIRDSGNSETAASSFIFEARYHWNDGRSNEAQSKLMELVENFPNSAYAAVALYEAGINAERQNSSDGDQQAIQLYNRIAELFPDHPLHLIAKLRQGDILRRSNEFALAVSFYESLIGDFAGDTRIHMIEMALGESYLALGSTREEYVEDGVRLLERLFDFNSLPVDVRIEAGVKASSGLSQVGRMSRSRELLWRVFLLGREYYQQQERLGATGRYWLARSALQLSDQLKESNDLADVYQLLELVEQMQLPGMELIRKGL